MLMFKTAVIVPFLPAQIYNLGRGMQILMSNNISFCPAIFADCNNCGGGSGVRCHWGFSDQGCLIAEDGKLIQGQHLSPLWGWHLIKNQLKTQKVQGAMIWSDSNLCNVLKSEPTLDVCLLIGSFDWWIFMLCIVSLDFSWLEWVLWNQSVYFTLSLAFVKIFLVVCL